MKKTYGVVLVGCGHIGGDHIADIYYRENIHICGVVDKNLDLAHQFAKRYQADSYSDDYKEYLTNPDVDIFIIATYTNTHLPILEDCIKHGIHVLCEKPMAATLDETRKFRDLVLSAPIKVRIGHILRFNHSYLKVKELIDAGAIGKPIVMRMAQNHHCMNWPRYKRLLDDCPPVIDCGVHYFDVMQWMTGSQIRRVSGIKSRLDDDLAPGAYNYSIVNLQMEDGSVGYYESGWSRSMASSNTKEFVGPRGRIRLVYQNLRPNHQEEGDEIELYNAETGEYRMINLQSKYKPMWEQLSALIEAVEKDIPNEQHIQEAYSAARVAFCCDEALRKDSFVDVDPEL